MGPGEFANQGPVILFECASSENLEESTEFNPKRWPLEALKISVGEGGPEQETCYTSNP